MKIPKFKWYLEGTKSYVEKNWYEGFIEEKFFLATGKFSENKLGQCCVELTK